MDEKAKKENERKKEYLWGYKRAKQQWERAEEDIKELRMNKIYPSMNNDGMPHGSNQNDLSDYAAKLDELITKSLKKRHRKIVVMQKIRDKIEKMENEDEKDILTYRYVRLMEWKEICKKTGYCWQHVHRTHSNALKKFKM